MRIGIDGSCWPNRRGFGRFTRSLVTEMARRRPEHRYMLLIDAPSAATVDAEAAPGLDVVPVAVSRPPAEAASSAGRRTVLDILRMTRAARHTSCDAFFFPSTYTYFPVPGTPTAVTIHDAIAETVPDLVFPDRAGRFLWDIKQRAALREAIAVFAVSEAARADILRRLPVTGEVTVIHEAPDPKFRPLPAPARAPVLRRFGLGQDDRYLMYVGGISPHKNLVTLVAAFDRVARGDPGLRLLIVGDTSEDPFLSSTSSVRRAVQGSPTGQQVTLTGFVDDDSLVALYGGAVATVLPSLGEGFGLTAAESAACGTPVVASPLPALLELLGDAGVYADPTDADALAAALARPLQDAALRERLAQASLARAASWSWTAAAHSVVTTLEHIGSAALDARSRGPR
ncbi:MAG: glycosyltransferase family 4 protein [Acidimicrobiales bacterium]